MHQMWSTTFDAGNPPIRFGGRGEASFVPTPIHVAARNTTGASEIRQYEEGSQRRAEPFILRVKYFRASQSATPCSVNC
jgi:hypothetical protein